MSNNFTYFFHTDYGEMHMKHSEYLKNEELKKMVRSTSKKPGGQYLTLGRWVYAFSPEFMKDKPAVAKELDGLRVAAMHNPIAYYAPNSQEQLDFINDTVPPEESPLYIIRDSNRVGKSTASWVKMLLWLPLIETDPEWPVFKYFGIKHRPFTGPKSVGVCTYNTSKLEDPIWKEMIRKWTPDYELGVYGRTYRGKGSKWGPSWGHDRSIRLKHSKSQIGFYTYESDQGNFEGGALDAWWWDEQGKKAQFDGADRGTQTSAGVHIFSLTPHRVPGRPDTGAAGWLYAVINGANAQGQP